jgi:hypothetical protein
MCRPLAVPPGIEHADYLLGSLSDLRSQLDQWLPLWQKINETAETLVRQQGEREALAYRCMITRDLCHILELYCTCMRSAASNSATHSAEPATCEAQECHPALQNPPARGAFSGVQNQPVFRCFVYLIFIGNSKGDGSH